MKPVWTLTRDGARWVTPPAEVPRLLVPFVAAIVVLVLAVGAIGTAAAPVNTSPTMDPRAVIVNGEVVGWHGTDGQDGWVTVTWTVEYREGEDGTVTPIPLEEQRAQSVTYSTPGSSTGWVVPAGVTTVVLDLRGGGGGGGALRNGSASGSSTSAAGGAGGRVQGTLTVVPGDTVTIRPGGGGGGATNSSAAAAGGTAGAAHTAAGGAGGATGGGGVTGSAGGGGGGGGSQVLLNGVDVAIAGGGGGGGGSARNAGRNATTVNGGLGGGATATDGGGSGGEGGVAGVNGAGGAGGVGAPNGTAGGVRAGGAGATDVSGNPFVSGGGGGGGGYGGGGGGGAVSLGGGFNTSESGGGAGGDGYSAGLSSVTVTQGGGGAGAASQAVGAGVDVTGTAGTNGQVGTVFTQPPLQPGVFTAPSLLKVGELTAVAWGTSGADPEGGTITYELYVRVNGAGPSLLATGIAATTYNYTATATGSVVFDVYARSSASGLASPVRQSGTIPVAGTGSHMIL